MYSSGDIFVLTSIYYLVAFAILVPIMVVYDLDAYDNVVSSRNAKFTLTGNYSIYEHKKTFYEVGCFADYNINRHCIYKLPYLNPKVSYANEYAIKSCIKGKELFGYNANIYCYDYIDYTKQFSYIKFAIPFSPLILHIFVMSIICCMCKCNRISNGGVSNNVAPSNVVYHTEAFRIPIHEYTQIHQAVPLTEIELV
jgi:hypothetical protein